MLLLLLLLLDVVDVNIVVGTAFCHEFNFYSLTCLLTLYSFLYFLPSPLDIIIY